MTELSRLDPKVRLLWMSGSLIPAGVLGMIAFGLFLADVPIAPWIVGGLALFIALMGLVLAPARWRAWGYGLSETELIVRFGVVVKTKRWIPRTRVQYVDMIGGPIERALGLRTVTIYTAGSRLADLSIPGLPLHAAESIREDLLSWSRQATPEQGSADGDDADGDFDRWERPAGIPAPTPEPEGAGADGGPWEREPNGQPVPSEPPGPPGPPNSPSPPSPPAPPTPASPQTPPSPPAPPAPPWTS
ncbi:MAG: PH domain-containing protein [Acidimicrobiia bacterium]